MKQNLVLTIVVILLGVLVLSAYDATAVQPAEALAATEKTAEVVVAQSVDTPALAAPAATVVDAPLLSPTQPAASDLPARVEFPVSNGTVEIKVIDIYKPHSVYLGLDPILGTEVRFNPGAGNMFLDIGIRVRNSTGADIPMKWTDIYMANKHDHKYFGGWAVYRETDGTVDPLALKVLKYDRVDPDFDPDAHFYLGDDGFVRVIFKLPRNNLYYYLGFGDLPVIEIKNTYY